MSIDLPIKGENHVSLVMLDIKVVSFGISVSYACLVTMAWHVPTSGKLNPGIELRHKTSDELIPLGSVNRLRRIYTSGWIGEMAFTKHFDIVQRLSITARHWNAVVRGVHIPRSR